MSQAMNAFNQTVAIEHGSSLIALASANQRLADVQAKATKDEAKAAEDKTIFEASIKKLKDRIAELETQLDLAAEPLEDLT